MRFLIALLMVLGTEVHAELPYNDPKSVCITASGGSPIPVTFTTSTQSKILTDVSAVGIGISQNSLVVPISIEVGTTSDGAAPSTSSTKQLFVPAGALMVIDNLKMSSAVYIRATGGATATAGTICFFTK